MRRIPTAIVISLLVVLIVPVQPSDAKPTKEQGQISAERLRFENAIMPVASAFDEAMQDDPRFGGVWLDPESDEQVLYVGVVDGTSLELHLDMSGLGVPDGRVEYVSVRYSHAQLLDELYRIAQVDEEDDSFSLSLYTDVALNTVVIEPARHGLSDSNLATLGIDTEMVVVGVTASTAPTAYQGGQRLINLNTAHGCTAGFTVRQGNKYGTLTAAHCAQPTDQVDQLGVTGGQNPTRLGNGLFWKFEGNADRQIRRYINPGDKSKVLVNGRNILGPVNLIQGSAICKYGHTTKTMCGSIETITFKPDSIPQSTAHFIRTNASVQSKGGDSGGPAYANVHFDFALAAGVTYGCQHFIVSSCNSSPIWPAWNKAILTRISSAMEGTGYTFP